MTVNCSAPLAAATLLDWKTGSENFCAPPSAGRITGSRVKVSRIRPGSVAIIGFTAEGKAQHQAGGILPELLAEAEPQGPDQQTVARMQLHRLRQYARQHPAQSRDRHKTSAAKQHKLGGQVIARTGEFASGLSLGEFNFNRARGSGGEFQLPLLFDRSATRPARAVPAPRTIRHTACRRARRLAPRR